MKEILIMALTVTFAACAATPPKSMVKEVEKAPAKPAPIEVHDSAPVLAEIDPVTLKITYHKGVDPKAFANQMVQAWAQAIRDLAACQAEVKRLGEPKK